MSISRASEGKTCFYCKRYKNLKCTIAKRKKAPDAPACERFFRPKTRLEEFVGRGRGSK